MKVLNKKEFWDEFLIGLEFILIVTIFLPIALIALLGEYLKNR